MEFTTIKLEPQFIASDAGQQEMTSDAEEENYIIDIKGEPCDGEWPNIEEESDVDETIPQLLVKTELNSEIEFRSCVVNEVQEDPKNVTIVDKQHLEKERSASIGRHSSPPKPPERLQPDSEEKESPDIRTRANTSFRFFFPKTLKTTLKLRHIGSYEVMKQYDPETKRRFMHWKSPSSPGHNKPRMICVNSSSSFKGTTEMLYKKASSKEYWKSGIDSSRDSEVTDSPIIVDVGGTCNKKKYQCTLCDKGFGKKSTLKLHLRIHWGENAFKCAVCGKDFSCNGNLIRHLRIHTGEKPYHCTLCGKEFTQSSILTKHTRVHFRERPYKCTSCGKHFSQKYHLTIHVRTHSKERPFRCVSCDIGFSQRSHLTKHLLVHAGKRPYSCTVCSQDFSDRSHLAIHVRTHSTEESYICALCSKSFTKKCSLIRHLIIHTGERPFYCTSCGKSFTQSAHLKGHQRKLCNVALQGD